MHRPVFTDIREQHIHYHIHGQSGQLGTVLIRYINEYTLLIKLLALEKLQGSVLVDAELHSEKRSPQPQCLAGTRVELIKDAKSWMTAEHAQALMWMFGLMGVGKSALAQTLGLWAEEEKILGAAVFFSDERNDPSHLFISIAHQLLRLDVGGPYRFRVANALGTADTALSSQSLSKQFNELLLKPLSGLATERDLIIIIDGLDECPKDKQYEIIHLIGKMANSPQAFPLRWLICSRLEQHLNREIRQVFETSCKRQEVPLNSSDVRVFLQNEFSRIASRRDLDGADWPEQGEIERIATASDGLFIHASTVIQFIDDDLTPDENLQTVLEDIDEESSQSTISGRQSNPLQKLDFLYRKTLSRVEKRCLSTTLRLLGATAFHSPVPVLLLANLLGVSHEMFEAALQKLHSVVHVPPRDKARFDHIRFFHASFAGFLKTKSRSYVKANKRRGEQEVSYYIDSRQTRVDLAKVCFQALGQTKLRYTRELSWLPSSSDHVNILSLAHQVISYAASCVWSICVDLDKGDTSLLDMITNFDFKKLRFVQSQLPTKPFYEFIKWLSKEVTVLIYLSVLFINVYLQSKRIGHRDIVRWDDPDSCLFVSDFSTSEPFPFDLQFLPLTGTPYSRRTRPLLYFRSKTEGSQGSYHRY